MSDNLKVLVMENVIILITLRGVQLTMISKFESLFTTKDLVRCKYPNGWVGWLNDKMSDEDDGKLTRFSTMDGRYMYIIVERLIERGFRPPELIGDTIHFHDFYLSVYEYLDYSKYKKKIPAWLNIQAQPEKSLVKIDNLCLDAYAF